MGFKKGIEKCVECEKKMSEDPNETGMCSKQVCAVNVVLVQELTQKYKRN